MWLPHFHTVTPCACGARLKSEELLRLNVQASIENLVHGQHVTPVPVIVEGWQA